MELRQQVLHYYLDNFQSLRVSGQFHFASRIGAWLGLPEATEHLKSLRADMMPESAAPEAFTQLFQDKIAITTFDKVNAPELRAPYFAKYAPIRGVELAVFRLHWLQVAYSQVVREPFLNAISLSTLQNLEAALLQDPQAVRALSTYAINFIYLFHIDILQDNVIPRQYFYDLGMAYDAHNPEQLQLLIYLYTHCILCETGFYTRRIAPEYVPLYRDMLTVLEKEIDQHFDAIHLDNKLEFLVCCQICDFPTHLRERIDAECQKSVSDDGTFLVDRHNTNPQIYRRSFVDSEHRNALFIMSGSAYNPHPIAV